MKKFILTTLAFTLIGGTAMAENNVVSITPTKNGTAIKAQSNSAVPTFKSISANHAIGGKIKNENKGFFAVNTSNIGSVVSHQSIANVSFIAPRIERGSGKVELSFMETLAVGASKTITETKLVHELKQIKP